MEATVGQEARPEKKIDNVFFYDPALFPQFQILSDNRNVITAELTRALQSQIVRPDTENGAELSGVWCEDKVFDDFYARTKNVEGWLHWWSVNNPHQPNNDWTIFGLLNGGQYMTENCKKCPETTKLLAQIPGLRVAGFSRMQPSSGIATHKGFTGRRYGALAYHLGLLIPPSGARLVCGPETHHWSKAGEVIVFDDTFPHSAWNDSDQERVILYIDFKIPEAVLDKLGEIPVEHETYESSDEETKADLDADNEDTNGLSNLTATQLLQMFLRFSTSKHQQQQQNRHVEPQQQQTATGDSTQQG